MLGNAQVAAIAALFVVDSCQYAPDGLQVFKCDAIFPVLGRIEYQATLFHRITDKAGQGLAVIVGDIACSVFHFNRAKTFRNPVGNLYLSEYLGRDKRNDAHKQSV